jgi:hypothetical protein
MKEGIYKKCGLVNIMNRYNLREHGTERKLVVCICTELVRGKVQICGG